MKYNSSKSSWSTLVDTTSIFSCEEDWDTRTSGYGYVCPNWGVKNRLYKVSFKKDDLVRKQILINLDIFDIITSHDIVLMTYEGLRLNAAILKKIHWHRIVLDECQEIKVSTNQIATLCANLNANYRWMVSGTPFVSKIEDLHGELNFLKVWPFSLNNKRDGFWDHKIGKPFADHDEQSLKLLYLLIDNVMMRHTKSQSYLDGRSLVKLPPRVVEWRGFDITNIQEKYLIKSLEVFMVLILSYI